MAILGGSNDGGHGSSGSEPQAETCVTYLTIS